MTSRAVLLMLCTISVASLTGCEISNHDDDEDTTAVTENADGTDVADTGNIQWLGPDLSSAVIDGVMSSATIDGDVVRVSYSVDWEPEVPSVITDLCTGMMLFFREIDGQFVGGKFEWVTVNQTVKTLENIRNGYNGHTTPESGETVYFALSDVRGNRRTAMVSAVWP